MRKLNRILAGMSLLLSLATQAQDPRVRIDVDGVEGRIAIAAGKIPSDCITYNAAWRPSDGECYRVFSFPSDYCEWAKSEFSFTPGKDGKVKIILRGDYFPKDAGSKELIPVWCHIGDVKIEGADLKNGGFLPAADGKPEGWNLDKEALYVADRKFSHDGAGACVKVWCDAKASQTVAVKAGQEVKVSFWQKGAGPNSAPVPESACGVNLVANPGFEEPDSQTWRLNNWYTSPKGEKNDCEAAFDTDKPHSGKYCQRIAMRKHAGMDIQFQQRLPKLKAGDALELRFWIRGTSNTKPIRVWMLDSSKYTKYMDKSASCSEEWGEFVFRMLVPQNANVKNVGLWFSTDDEGCFWLDDVSLVRLPTVEGGEPLKGNQISNGSFEAGRDKWYGCIDPSHSLSVGYSLAPEAVEKSISMNLEAVETPDAPQGRKALHIKNEKECTVTLTSACFPLRYGRPATVSFWMKTPKHSSLGFALASGDYQNLAVQGGKRNVINTKDGDWKRYSFTYTPAPSADGRYFIEFSLDGQYAPEIWLDGVTVTEGENPPDVSPADFQCAGWETLDGAHPGNVHYKGEKVEFRILSSGVPGQGEASLSGRVLDTWENPIEKLSVKVPLDANGLGQTTLSLPSDRFGSFKCELYSGDAKAPSVEVVYHVVPKLKPLKDVSDSFFGGHFTMTPYNLSIAEKAGFRWLRYHAPVDTKWSVVQPKPGDFVFHLEGTKRAHEMGFKLFGTFGKTPAWAEDRPEKVRSPYGLSSYAPADYDAWDKYVVETAKAFSPYIKIWEVWNEPDIVFLQVPPGKSKEDAYMTIAQRTQAALEKAGMDVTLVGPAFAGWNKSFAKNVLDRKVTEHFDVFSIHCYGLGQLSSILTEMPNWKSLKDRKGQPIEYWQSEGQPSTSGVHSWLKTSGHVLDDPHLMARDAAGLAKMLALVKAAGFKKNFHYLADAHPAGRLVYRNEWHSMIDINGIPYPPLATHAAAVLFLEGTETGGYEELPMGDSKVTVCKFSKDGKGVKVIWTSSSLGLQKAMEAACAKGWKSFDMMANPLPADSSSMLSFSPVYLLE